MNQWSSSNVEPNKIACCFEIGLQLLLPYMAMELHFMLPWQLYNLGTHYPSEHFVLGTFFRVLSFKIAPSWCQFCLQHTLLMLAVLQHTLLVLAVFKTHLPGDSFGLKIAQSLWQFCFYNTPSWCVVCTIHHPGVCTLDTNHPSTNLLST